jgi:Flp pilus assembly protein TadG
MPSPADSTTSAIGVLRRFRRSRGGSAAVEFALVAPAFFALLFAIIETAIMFFAGQVLETITQTSARTILTGQTQTAGLTLTQYQNNVVCPLTPVIFDCHKIFIDVENYTSSFQNIVINNEIDTNGNFTSGALQFSPGNPGDVVVVRLFYKWPLFVTGLGYNVSNLTGNQRLLVATAAFRNEPY